MNDREWNTYEKGSQLTWEILRPIPFRSKHIALFILARISQIISQTSFLSTKIKIKV